MRGWSLLDITLSDVMGFFGWAVKMGCAFYALYSAHHGNMEAAIYGCLMFAWLKD